MVKLKRLKIGQYRNVKPGTELHFRDSFNVLLGKNGTGKTTLLELLSQLLRWDFSRLAHEPCDVEYEVVSQEGRVVVGVRVEPNTQGLEIPELSPPVLYPKGFSNRVSVKIVTTLPGGAEYVLLISGSRLRLLGTDEAVIREVDTGQSILNEEPLPRTVYYMASDSYGKLTTDAEIAVIGLIKGFWAPFLKFKRLWRFDESLGYLEHVCGLNLTVYKTGGSYRFVPDIDFPDVLEPQFKAMMMETPDVDELVFESRTGRLNFLGRAVQLMGFESGQLRLRSLSRRIEPAWEVDFGLILFDFFSQNGSKINHRMLSYGQKRLLAFYYYLACNSECVVADELVNGMHHEWIEACLDDIGERQAFLTSQNPLLLDYLSFDSAEDVRSSFVLCRVESKDGREQFIWENMSAQDAEGLYKAYQVPIQHVGELLRTRGLW